MPEENTSEGAEFSPLHKHHPSNPERLLSAKPPDASYSIAGTWTGWHRVGMTWEAGCFVHTVTVGQSGWESFQILLNGSWEQAFYPSVQDGSPLAKYTLRGPDAKGHGRNWTIGRPPDKRLWRNFAMPGDKHVISVFVDDDGLATTVTWQHARDGGGGAVHADGASLPEAEGHSKDSAHARASLEWRPPASAEAKPHRRAGQGWWRVAEARGDMEVGDIILLRPGDVALGRRGLASRSGEVLRIEFVEDSCQDEWLLGVAGQTATTAPTEVAAVTGDAALEGEREERPQQVTREGGEELEVEVWRVPDVRGWGHAPSVQLKEPTSSLRLRVPAATTVGGLREAIRAGLPVEAYVWDGRGDGLNDASLLQALLADGVKLFYELYHDVRVYHGGLEGYFNPKMVKVTVKASATLYDVKAAVVKRFWHKRCALSFVEEEAHGVWRPCDEDARLDGRSEVCATGGFMDELVAYDADEEAEVHLWDLPHAGKRVRCRIEGTSDAGEHYDIHILPTVDYDAAGGRSDTYVPHVSSEKLRKTARVGAATETKAKAGSGKPPLTRETTLELLHELLAGYRSEDFQRCMRDLLAHYPDRTGYIPQAKYYTGYYTMRKQVLLSVQSVVLPRFGFSGHQGGTVMMVAAISQFKGDQEIDLLSREVNGILQEMYHEQL